MISKNERQLTEYVNRYTGKTIGVITSDILGNTFWFYEFNGKDYKKIGKANSPPELEVRYKLDERIRSKT